jgi:hypothetical protein
MLKRFMPPEGEFFDLVNAHTSLFVLVVLVALELAPPSGPGC